MSATDVLDEPDLYDDVHDDQIADEDAVEVRRSAGLSAAVGAVASGVGIAYLARATGTGDWLDWALFVVMGALGVAHLLAFLDARTPLLVADHHGVRIRLGRAWHGMTWGALSRVEHLPRRGPFRDGRLVLVPRNAERALAELDDASRRQSRLSERLYGAPFALPLALSTHVVGDEGDLTGSLVRLAGAATRVVEIGGSDQDDRLEQEIDDHREPAPAGRWHDPRPALALGIGAVAARLQRHRAEDVAAHSHGLPLVASAAPSPLREPVVAIRAEVRHGLTLGATALQLDDLDASTARELPEARELRRPGSVSLVEDTLLWGQRIARSARGGSAGNPAVIGDHPIEASSIEPAEDPVIGPQLAAARTRLGLSVDQLADRTRIRPHVIESIEVDDFAPCGGDFYARGHLRTLARVLGIDAAPLLASYAERYSAAPIDPRRVFEAELATGLGGSIRGTRGGPNWSVLIAAVMVLVLAWSVARLIMDSPVELRQPAPPLNGSHGLDNGARLGDPVPVVLTAAGGGAHVVVRDGAGKIVFNGNVAFGESVSLDAAPPVRVQSSDGSLEATVDGEDRGALGGSGAPAQSTFPVR